MPDQRRYEDTHARALKLADRHLPRDQALEIAHDVTTRMLRLPEADVTPALIHVAVTNRVRDLWRADKRRSAVEAQYHDARANTPPGWSQPGSTLEVEELHRRIMAVVQGMPPAMGQVFLLIREQELSYKEVAARLGIGVATVHTQLSRANALLYDCVARYNAGLAAPATPPKKEKHP
jgi:RNA polymerase sigma factor (sigma-70 family)